MEIRCEKPMPRAVAQSAMEVTTIDDCATSATSPFFGVTGPKLAFSPRPGTIAPRLLGPSRRIRCGLAAS